MKEKQVAAERQATAQDWESEKQRRGRNCSSQGFKLLLLSCAAFRVSPFWPSDTKNKQMLQSGSFAWKPTELNIIVKSLGNTNSQTLIKTLGWSLWSHHKLFHCGVSRARRWQPLACFGASGVHDGANRRRIGIASVLRELTMTATMPLCATFSHL